MKQNKVNGYRYIFLIVFVLIEYMILPAQEPVKKSKKMACPVKSDTYQQKDLYQVDQNAGEKPFDSFQQLPGRQGLTMPTMSYRLDSLRIRQIILGRNHDGLSNPFAIDFHDVGVLSTWKNGYLYGDSERNTMMGLMVMQDAQIGLIQQFGNFTAEVGVSANRYAFPYALRGGNYSSKAPNPYDMRTRFGVNGSLTYSFSENLSVTVFGNYVNRPFYYSMAAFPYIGTSSYGGYFTLANNNLGIDLGTQRQYDAFSHQWRTVPIVTPKFKMGKVNMELPLGELLNHVLERALQKNTRQGPIILPPPMR